MAEIREKTIEQRRERVSIALLAGLMHGGMHLSDDPHVFERQVEKVCCQAIAVADKLINILDKDRK